jgi:hypothetical protein
MNKKTSEMLKQKRLEAQVRAKQIEAKRRPLEESGYVKSQFGTLTNENRLFEMGYYKRESRAYGQKNKLEISPKNRVEWLMATNAKKV